MVITTGCFISPNAATAGMTSVAPEFGLLALVAYKRFSRPFDHLCRRTIVKSVLRSAKLAGEGGNVSHHKTLEREALNSTSLEVLGFGTPARSHYVATMKRISRVLEVKILATRRQVWR
jgi:hypothetical protein